MFDDQTARHVQRMVLSPEETIEDGGVLKVHYRLELVRLPSLHTVVLELPRSEVRDCRNVCEILKCDLDCETLLEPLNRQVVTTCREHLEKMQEFQEGSKYQSLFDLRQVKFKWLVNVGDEISSDDLVTQMVVFLNLYFFEKEFCLYR